MRFLKRGFFIFVLGIIVLLVATQVASYFFLKPLLERQAERIFQVPVTIERAGVNLLGGSCWMKQIRIKNLEGFKNPDFLTARTIAVDFNLLSLLTSEFVINRILLKDPEFSFELNEKGKLNLRILIDEVINRFQTLYAKKPRLIHLITRYTVEKFSVRNGKVEWIDHRNNENNWTLKVISFSLARLVYPPDPEEALPAAIYVNATVPTVPEGKILILGRFNPFASKKSFDITGSAKNLIFNQSSDFLPDFPLRFMGGILQLKVKALCHDNQVEMYHQVRVDRLKFATKDFIEGKPHLVFGLPVETVVHFFNDIQPQAEPFGFNFDVIGDLGDPKFNLWSQTQQKLQTTIYGRIMGRLKLLQDNVKSF